MTNIEDGAVEVEPFTEEQTIAQRVSEVYAEELAGHIDDHIDVDIHEAIRHGVDAKLIVWPSPNILSEIIEDEKEGDEGDEEGEQTARFRTRLVSGGKLGEGVELDELVEERH